MARHWPRSACCCSAAAPSPQGLTNYSPVTDARLTNPEPRNWLMTKGRYQGWSYSDLDQVNTTNVRNLVPVWSMSTGVDSGHEAPPIVNDGVMFVSTPHNQVLALDAKSGDLLWRYKRELPEEFSALHNTNRGVALYGDKVYFAALEATLVALDAKTGKVAWEANVGDWQIGEYMTLAPLIVNGKVMVGISGGEFGVRGRVMAFDAETGKPAWTTHTIPEPGQPGSETWRGEDWKRGGASVWMSGQLRSRDQDRAVRHRQRLALVRRPAPGRQSLHLVHDRPRPGYGCDQDPLPVSLERLRGTGTR